MFYSILKEPIIMERKFVRKDEQIKLIMECRQSGLSDYQWCRQRDINPGTFYNWVSRLRKSGYTFPDSQGKSVGTPVVQGVVLLNISCILFAICNCLLEEKIIKSIICVPQNIFFNEFSNTILFI